jgi:3-deoxy-D-manno-octulosonic-acid transferase
MMRRVYSWVMRCAQPLVRRKLARRAVAEPLYGQHVPERFGTYTTPPGQGYVWVHAVSLGETRAAAMLIKKLRTLVPSMRLLLTHGTATGRAEGAALLLPGDVQVWQPWDTPEAVHKFLKHFAPRIGIVMETEVWPNLCAAARAQGVPMVLANARLSEKSFTQALRWGSLARAAYASFTAVLAQTTADAQRLKILGSTVQSVLGNIKFDAAINDTQLQTGSSWRLRSPRPVVLLASSRDGEEALFLKEILAFSQQNRVLAATKSIADKTPISIQWMIVPRHPQRFDEVAQLIAQHGLSVLRRSQFDNAPEPADVWLGDSLGEMALYYGLSDVALLGGSFAPLGGQNLIEAAACECPLVMGPHTFNFADAAQAAQQCGAALRVPDMRSGVEAAALLARDGARKAQMRDAAVQWLAASSGAAQKTADAIVALMSVGAKDGAAALVVQEGYRAVGL